MASVPFLSILQLWHRWISVPWFSLYLLCEALHATVDCTANEPSSGYNLCKYLVGDYKIGDKPSLDRGYCQGIKCRHLKTWQCFLSGTFVIYCSIYWDYPFKKLAVATENTTSSLFCFSFISIFWQLLKKSLCPFQPFCFHPVKSQLCKHWLPPLSIFGTPIHQWQATGARGGKETPQMQETSIAGPSPLDLVELCQGGAWPRCFSSYYSFIDYLLECIKSPTFPSAPHGFSCLLWWAHFVFVLGFHFANAGLMINRGFLGIVGQVHRYVQGLLLQTQASNKVFLCSWKKKSKAEKLVLKANQCIWNTELFSSNLLKF